MTRIITAAILGMALLGIPLRASAADDKPEFNRDIRPILMDTCLPCHGADSASRKADLRLDQRGAAVDAGAIAPGSPDDSEMVRRIFSDDPEEVMPPPAIKKPLSDHQKQTLVRWIRDGAEYQEHWFYIAPVRPEVPVVSDPEYAAWPVNPIDAFIFAELQKHGLRPAEEADRRTLARRVSLDLTGLPPTREMVEQYVADSSPDAWEKLVDQLLQSPRWGEHRGRYWLDYARYADTHGIHFDNYREMWAYRDWVIRAFNRNLPFDEFTIENLAGDLLPDATLDQVIASGFHRCNMTTNEGGIIDEEYAVLYARDRTDTTGQVWLGLTLGCAVCHEHKFDPISQKEFYQLAAFFNNTTQPVRDGNIRDTPPIITVPLEEDRTRFAELPGEISAAAAAVTQRQQSARSEFEEWLATASRDDLGEPLPAEPLHFHATLDEGDGRLLHVRTNQKTLEIPLSDTAAWTAGPVGSALQVQGAAGQLPDVGDFAGDQPFSCAAWINVPASDGYGAICSRMDRPPGYRGWDFWMQQRRIGMHIISEWPERGLKVVSSEQVPANEWVHVAVTWDGSQKAAGVQVYINGRRQKTNVENNKLRQHPIQTDVPFLIGARTGGESFTGAIQDLRLYSGALSESEVAALAGTARVADLLAKPAAERKPQETDDIYQFWLARFDTEYREKRDHKVALDAELEAIRNRGTISHVMQEKDDAAHAFLLHRGEYDQRGERLEPGTPAVLPPFAEEAPRNRLGLARWLVSPDHPLTARVTVNRCWQEVFGTGIVRTTGDLGVSGELPSHQELLDWLAVEFRETGWDVKRLIKLMVMSAAYRQSAGISPEKLEKDPQNRLLSRGPRFRMDAEMVRDYALAVSGLLVDRIGGPSVRPYQPEGVWEAIAMNVSNTRSYERDTGENLYRRSLYTFVKRMAPPASMEIFNAPNREFCVVRRERTNTAIQALVTLNDEQFVEAARSLAGHVCAAAKDDLQRLDELAHRLLFRPFTPPEREIMERTVEQLREWYQQHPEDAELLIHTGESAPTDQVPPVELAAWTMVCNAAMNMDEVLNK